MTIRLLVANSEPVVRAGLSLFFRDTEIEIVAETDHASDLARLAAERSADLVLLDTSFPDLSGFEAAMLLRRSGYSGRILFFSSAGDDASFLRAAASGADSYLVQTAPPERLLRTIRGLTDWNEESSGRGTTPFAGELRRKTAEIHKRVRSQTGFPLTDREVQVLRYIAAGLGNKEIVAALNLKIDTVKEHVRNILRKLNCKNRAAAAVWAIKNGLF